jgi:hypothetical protein
MTTYYHDRTLRAIRGFQKTWRRLHKTCKLCQRPCLKDNLTCQLCYRWSISLSSWRLVSP